MHKDYHVGKIYRIPSHVTGIWFRSPDGGNAFTIVTYYLSSLVLPDIIGCTLILVHLNI